MKSILFFAVIGLSITVCLSSRPDPELHVSEFLTAYEKQDFRALARLTREVQSFVQDVAQAGRDSVVVGENGIDLLRNMKGFIPSSDPEDHKTVKEMLFKLRDDGETLGTDLHVVLIWINTRRVNGVSADASLDNASKLFRKALRSLTEYRKVVNKATSEVEEWMDSYEGHRFAILMQKIHNVAEKNRDKFSSSLAQAAKHFDSAIEHFEAKS